MAGLILAAPLAVLGGHRGVGLKVRDAGFFMTPEERRPPMIARKALGLKPLAPEPYRLPATEPARGALEQAS